MESILTFLSLVISDFISDSSTTKLLCS